VRGRGPTEPPYDLRRLPFPPKPPRDGLSPPAHPGRRRPVLAEGTHHCVHTKPTHRTAAGVCGEDQRGEIGGLEYNQEYRER
jgi:hypothetical protein